MVLQRVVPVIIALLLRQRSLGLLESLGIISVVFLSLVAVSSKKKVKNSRIIATKYKGRSFASGVE